MKLAKLSIFIVSFAAIICLSVQAQNGYKNPIIPGFNFHCTATDPAGPWSEPVWVAINSIDPEIFWDYDRQTYFVYDAYSE